MINKLRNYRKKSCIHATNQGNLNIITNYKKYKTKLQNTEFKEVVPDVPHFRGKNFNQYIKSSNLIYKILV